MIKAAITKRGFIWTLLTGATPGSRDLSDSWTGFTQFFLFEEKPPDGYMCPGGD